MGVASLDLQQTDAGQGEVDYSSVINKPKINGVTLDGDLATEDLNIIIPKLVSELQNDAGYITKNVDDLVSYYDKTEIDNMISTIPKFSIRVVDELPTEDISPTTIYLLRVEGDDHFEEWVYIDNEWDKLGDGNIDLSDYATYEYVDAELAEKIDAADLATVALSGRYSDLIGTPTNLSQFTNDTGFITAAALPTKTSDLTNDGEDGTSTYVESNELATVATSGSYNDLTDKPTIDFELVEMSYGESNAWAKFIAAYKSHKIVYCRAGYNANPATGAQDRRAFMAYVNNAKNPTSVEFQYVRSVSTKTAAQPVDQVFIYVLDNRNGGTWTVQTRDMAPKLAQGTNTTVSYSNGTYTISAAQPTVNDATLTIQKNGTAVETFTANSSTNKTANIIVPTKTSDITNDSDFVNSTQVGTALAAYTYPSQDLYTQSDIDTMLAQISSLKIEVVNALPQTGNVDTIYLLRVRQQGNDLYQEYFWVNNAWELIGGIDLTDYYTKTEVNTLLTAKADVSAIPTKTSDLTNDSNFAVDANYVHTDNNYTTAEKNKLAGIATGAEVNVQSNWTQTNSSADDFIKNKPSIPTKTSDLTNDSGFITSAAIPTNVSAFTNDAGYLDEIPDDSVGLNQLDSTIVNALNNINNKANTADLAPVAFSGDYDDLTDKPTIPTVNNATLTIQKNGTNVQTFTANQSTNATANITVPTNTNELTNGAGFITSSGTAAKANQLVTARTIAISGGVTGTATPFDGTSDISIPVTSVRDSYTVWGGKDIVGDISPDDAGCTDEFGHNKLAFLPAECIEVKYSTDGGTTWTDYGLTDAQKIALVTTTGPGVIAGKNATASASNIANMRGRIRIACGTADKKMKLYTALKKILINFSTNGANDTKVKIRRRTIANYLSGTETWDDLGTHNVSGWPGWNSYPYSGNFGGNMTFQTGYWGQIEFEWWGESCASGAINAKCSLIDIRFIGTTNWATPSEMAKNGRLYTIDTAQNATFPANVNVTGSLGHGRYTYTLPNKNGTVAMTSDIPTKTSDLTNDSNFVSNTDYATASTGGVVKVGSGLEITNGVLSATGGGTADAVEWDNVLNKPTFSTVATSGSYNDLTNKPTIPTVNNATLTIQRNNTNVATFTANASSNVTANISVPTATSDLTNDSGFITSITKITNAEIDAIMGVA